ncbi:hypothetical protein CH363_14530 [Leptospira haakeii]|uniref:Uncharacterized protein n=3 Tax=Leptospiraceae TaxID=170 RepID=A0A4R9FTF8_9LEPT|nr:hypothetical protein CH363_14530 [Leptospira haakeii]PKA20226.1 hypothetical protein CH377_08065 [Leptospira haakeii]TGK02176.1 hypothetical protein EHO58_16115 [Leptospira selangorensis]TGM11440.1 hypothetical protein EHQ81_17370 [Leptospira selangorensis]TGM21089.1 hypothetical protein EHQ82_08755 [Leptospira selangorensis]
MEIEMAILDKIVQEFKTRFFETVKVPVQVHSSSGDFQATWEGIQGTALSFTLDRFHPDPEGSNAVIEIRVPFWKEPLLFSGKLLDKKVVKSKSSERITDTVLVFESELSEFLKKNLPKIDLTLPKK